MAFPRPVVQLGSSGHSTQHALVVRVSVGPAARRGTSELPARWLPQLGYSFNPSWATLDAFTRDG